MEYEDKCRELGKMLAELAIAENYCTVSQDDLLNQAKALIDDAYYLAMQQKQENQLMLDI